MPRKPANPTPEPIEPEPATPTVPEASAVVEPATVAPAVAYAPAPSYLDRVRGNRMGPLAAALVVGVLVGLLLSTLVPAPINVWALILLGTLVAAAVGFAVRYLSATRGWAAQVPAFIGTVLGVHLMAVAGSINGIGTGKIGEFLKVQGPGFDDGLLAALAAPAFSAGTILAALVAAIIAGWGPRDEDEPVS